MARVPCLAGISDESLIASGVVDLLWGVRGLVVRARVRWVGFWVSASLFACRVAWSDVDAAHGSTFGARRGATTRRPDARLTALAEGRAHSCVQLYVREARG